MARRKTRYRKLARVVAHRFSQAISNVAERILDPEALLRVDLTPHEVIYQDDLLKVLHYEPLAEAEITVNDEQVPVQRTVRRVPLVCIPPLLAPHFAFDLVPDRSLVKFFLARGFQVYLIDFGDPGRDHAHLTFEHYLCTWLPDAMAKIRAHSGEEEVSLFGYCMGGLFALLYAAVNQDTKLRNIVTVGSPIDMHQAGAAGAIFSVIGLPAHLVAKYLHLDLRKIDPRIVHVPGELGTLFFYLTNPLGVLKSHWDLLLRLWDREYLAEHVSMGHWFNNLLDYPGATMQELVVQIGMANRLGRKGKMRIGKQMAKLEDISAAMLSFAGSDDEIVPVRSARLILEKVSSSDKTFCVVPGGHVGIIVGGSAPRHMWATAAEWLAERSG